MGLVRILWPSIRILRVWPKILWWILRTPLWIRIRILRLKTVLECNILPFFKQPPFGAFETYTTALCNITENCVFYEKIVTKLIFGPIVIKNSQKMPLFLKKGPVQHHPYCSLVMISNHYPRL